MKNKNAKKSLVVFVVLIVLAAFVAVLWYYQYMKRQHRQDIMRTPTTEVEKLIAKDLEEVYPETPKEVMKLFSRFNQCMYNNKDLSEEDFLSLVKQLRMLYSQELQKQNELKQIESKLASDVKKYRKEKKKIVNYTIDEERNYKYKTIEGRDMVYLKYSYFMRDGSKYSTWNQKAILVKENDKWKILGFGASAEEKEKASKSKK